MKHAALLAIFVLGCGTGPETPQSRPTASLVDHGAWKLAGEDADPYSGFRAGGKVCGEDDFSREEISGFDSVQIVTRRCNYMTLTQTAAADVLNGEQIHIRLWQYQLEATTATAELAIRIGNVFEWTESIPLPSDSKLFNEKVTVDKDIPAGTPIFLHVRNHGRNSYHLIMLSRE
jgi:hypothetical protein